MSPHQFCTRCGTALPPTSAHCPACGAPADPNSAVAPPGSKRGVVAAVILTIAVVGIIVGALLGLGVVKVGGAGEPSAADAGTSAQPDASQTAEPPEPTSSETANAGDSAPASDAEVGDASVSARAPQESSTTGTSAREGSLNLSTPEDAYLINRYLSNFSELNSFMDGYRSEKRDTDQIFFFAYGHALLNAPKSAQEGEFWPNHVSSPYYSRVPMELLSSYSQLFLKVPFTTNDVPFDFTAFEDSYVYSYLSDLKPEGIAVATKLTLLGDGEYLVDFDIYGSGYDYNVTDDAYYRMSARQLSEFFDQPYPAYRGTATIAAGYDDKDAPFKLLDYHAEPL